MYSPTNGYFEGIDVEDNIHWTRDINRAKMFGIAYHIALMITDIGAKNLPEDINFCLKSLAHLYMNNKKH
jgi:hypothetical protein